MELAFETLDIRSLCENEACAARKLGPEVSETLKRRLADIRAAKSLEDLLVGNPRMFMCGGETFLAVDISEHHCLVLADNHPRKLSARTKNRVRDGIRRLRVVRIGNSNDH